MPALKVLICDDEPGMRMILRRFLERDPAFTVTAEAADGREALELFEKHRPDVVFLDVDMPGMTGVEVARSISDLDPSACIIFATAHEGYRREAFEVYAFDYLVKPFSLERIDETLDRIRLSRSLRMEKKESGPSVQKVMIRGRDGISFIDPNEILLLQREERMTVIYTADARYQSGDSLQEWMEKLDPDRFMRCHKSYIINLNAVTEVYPYGRWTYVAKLRGITQDALVTAERLDELEAHFKK